MTTFKENNSQFWAHTPENILGPHSRKYSGPTLQKIFKVQQEKVLLDFEV